MGLLTRLGRRVGGKNGQGRLSVGQSLSDVNTVRKKKNSDAMLHCKEDSVRLMSGYPYLK